MPSVSGSQNADRFSGKGSLHTEVMALIPARGGSKGVTRKNIRPLLGKPLIAYTIQEAMKSEYINRIIVSTDDEEIVKIAEAYSAEVPFMRPSELGGDHVTDLPVFQHALKWLLHNTAVRLKFRQLPDFPYAGNILQRLWSSGI